MKDFRLVQDIKAQADSLARVLQQQHEQGASAILRAASLIRSRNRVLITGIGASMFASIPLQYFLCACGIDAVLIEAGELFHYLHHTYRDAVVIIVSRSGESVEIARVLTDMKARQPIIGVTNEPASLLAREADISLHIGSLPDEMVAIQTYTGTLVTLHILGAAVNNDQDAAKDTVESSLPSFAGLVEASLENLNRWDRFLEIGSPVHLLARAPSYGSALEGALLFNEIAKHTAVGMPSASFLHGPVELVDNHFRGLIFAPDGWTRHLNLALAQNLVRFGGQVRIIGPSPEGFSEMEWYQVPESHESLAPLFEIVPVQVAALRMAQLHGIVPGSFRYTPQVATDEASFAPV